MNMLNVRLDQRDEALRQEERRIIAEMLLKTKYGKVPEHLAPLLEKASHEALQEIITQTQAP